MKIVSTTILACMSFAGTVFGQYEKVYYRDTTFETDLCKITIDNIVALPKEVKFRMNISNKTADWVLYNCEESSFVVNGTKLAPKEKYVLIPPFDSKKKVMQGLGSNLNAARSFEFYCDGFKKVSLNAALKAPEFRLPASVNEFSVGDFKVTLANVSKTTAKTDVKYNVTYSGEGLGFVSPAKVSVKMPDGNSYVSAKSKADVIAIKKGETESFVASWERFEGGSKMDMQLVEMLLQFENVFQTSSQEKVPVSTVTLTWNDALTIGKK